MPAPEELFAGFPDAVVCLDENGVVTGWHGAAQRLFGWSQQEALGRDVDHLLRPRLPSGDVYSLREGAQDPGGQSAAAKQPGSPEQELLVNGRDGSQIWVGVVYGSAPGARSTTEKVASLRDIRHRKGVDIAKSDVISSVAHELRSPLTSIKGFSATLSRKWDRFSDERRRQIIATIESDADRVTRLISELLDISRLEEGRLQLKKQPVQIASVAVRVSEHLRDRSQNHSIVFRSPDSLPAVMADPDKIEQILTNLVENAVKYTRAGKVTIEGAVRSDSVLVRVLDEGPGVPADQRESVFRKFFRRTDLPASAGEGPPGSGLGLYICRGLIEAHGGRIWVEDAPGGGAAFCFVLPLG